MSPHRRKARGGGGGKISFAPPYPSLPLTCKILQDRRALRKSLASAALASSAAPQKPSSLCAHTVPSPQQEKPQTKTASTILAPVAAAPPYHHHHGKKFYKPSYTGHNFSTSIMPCRGIGFVAENNHVVPSKSPFVGAARAKRSNITHDIKGFSKRTGKIDAAKAGLNKAVARCNFQMKIKGKPSMKRSPHIQADFDEEEGNVSMQKNPIYRSLSDHNDAEEKASIQNGLDIQVIFDGTCDADNDDDHHNEDNISLPKNLGIPEISNDKCDDVDDNKCAVQKKLNLGEFNDDDGDNGSGGGGDDGSGSGGGTGQCEEHSPQNILGIQVVLNDNEDKDADGKDATISEFSNALQKRLTLFEDMVSHIAEKLKKTTEQLDAKLYHHVVLLSHIQRKVSSIEGIMTGSIDLQAFDQ